MNRDLLASVIERWRSASMSHRMSDDLYDDLGSPFDSPALQPAQAPQPAPQQTSYYAPPQHAPAPAASFAPAAPQAPAPRPELRSSLLKKPLDGSPASASGKPTLPLPSRFR
jgi:hypothetical protein